MSPESSLDAAGVARREFSFVRRGCDPDEVRAFVREVAELVEDLERRLAAARERADRAEQLDEHRLIELVGEETARVLDAARDAAAEIRTKAQESAARLVEEGHDERQRIINRAEVDAATRKVEILAEAEALRHQAEVELDQRRAEGESLAEELRHEAQGERDRLIAEGERARLQGEADAERIRDAARQEGHQLVGEAEAARERVLGDLARRRHTARQQLERLNAARERLLAAYTIVRRTVDEATTELTIALPEAKVASDNAMRRARDEPEATVEELEAELSAARLVGLLDSDAATGAWSEVASETAALDRTPTADADIAGAATEANESQPAGADIAGAATETNESGDPVPVDAAPGGDAEPGRPTERDPIDATSPEAEVAALPAESAFPETDGFGFGVGAGERRPSGHGPDGSPTTPEGRLTGDEPDRGRPPAAPGPSSGAPHGGRRGLWPFRRRSSAGRTPEPHPDQHVVEPSPHDIDRHPSGLTTEPPPDQHVVEPSPHEVDRPPAAPPADQHDPAPGGLHTPSDAETVADADSVTDTPVHDEPPVHDDHRPATGQAPIDPGSFATTGEADDAVADQPPQDGDGAAATDGDLSFTADAADVPPPGRADRAATAEGAAPLGDEGGPPTIEDLSSDTDPATDRQNDVPDDQPAPAAEVIDFVADPRLGAVDDGEPGERPSVDSPPAISPVNGASIVLGEGVNGDRSPLAGPLPIDDQPHGEEPSPTDQRGGLDEPPPVDEEPVAGLRSPHRVGDDMRRDDAPKVVDELFARIKAERGQPQQTGERDTVAERRGDDAASTGNGAGSPDEPAKANPAAATPHPESAARPEHPTTFDRHPQSSTPSTDTATTAAGASEPNAEDADDDPDARWLRHRDAALAAVEATLARRLKRVLADEQNEVLDLVRQAKPGSLAELVPGVGPHVERYAAVARPELEAAAAEGAAVVGGAPPTSCAAIADELGEALVIPMRERLGRSLDESGDDADEVTGRLRSLYRQWKRQRIGEVVHHYAAAAYAAGTFAASSAGTELRWVVDRSGDACPDAEDNALARGVRKGDPFPTGDRCAPAHPGCRCLVVPAAPGARRPHSPT